MIGNASFFFAIMPAMKKTLQIQLEPKDAFDEELCAKAVLKKARISASDDVQVRVLRRSVDGRSRQVQVNLQVEIYVKEAPPALIQYKKDYPNVSKRDPVIIVGCGPAGMFAALRLLELGIKPIIFERGSDVQKRRHDLAAINKEHHVNPESNYCFGEGGAGTYSDGKLYTRSHKRGNIQKILEILVAHGAKEDILIEAHPHIGTNKLPQVVAAMRESILQAGGEIHFDTKVTDLLIEGDEMKGVVLGDGSKVTAAGVILATGHSARDIFQLLDRKKVLIEAKSFALGIRIEHPQALIDKMQYHCEERGPYLPAASYSMAHQSTYNKIKRGVFSFCMCPGGFIVPAATAPGEIVVNGMSPSRRDSEFANSGIVASIEVEDLEGYKEYGALTGMIFQREIEQLACQLAEGNQSAPAQKMVDFVEGKVSSSLNPTSYQPGLVSVDMQEVLPEGIHQLLKEAFKTFGKKRRGYLTNEAQIIGVESRTSSPVRVPRDKITCEHVQVKRLYPCGEGAGYAGGIISAAMDGEKCADQLAQKYLKGAVSG